jgi:hypothetical protein
VLSIEPRSHHRGDEELGSVGVGPGIGHGQKAFFSVLKLEVLIWEEGEIFIAGPKWSIESNQPLNFSP